jgi:hypothetical protein
MQSLGVRENIFLVRFTAIEHDSPRSGWMDFGVGIVFL